MDQKKFEAVMILLVPQIIHLVVENNRYDEVTASKKFYRSNLYALLEQEDTKLWHLSPMTLYHMYSEEQTTGNILFPEEA